MRQYLTIYEGRESVHSHIRSHTVQDGKREETEQQTLQNDVDERIGSV